MMNNRVLTMSNSVLVSVVASLIVTQLEVAVERRNEGETELQRVSESIMRRDALSKWAWHSSRQPRVTR